MIYAFDEFELDEELFELRHRGEPVPVQARVWKTIAHLLQQRTRVVGKAELLEAVWAGTVVSETAISQVIMLARKALGDDTGQQRIIKTVRGRGFRFAAKVELLAERRARAAGPDPVTTRPALAGDGPEALIGRDAEWCELTERAAAAERGKGGLVLIGGEPGIGKSSLVAALAAHCSERGQLVLWGKAWEEGGAPPFWPWVQVLRGLLGHCGPALQRLLLAPGFEELRAIVPELDALAPASSARALASVDGAHARFRLFDAMGRLLRALTGAPARGGERPLSPRACVVILEDLHAVDQASVQLLRFSSQDLDGLSLLIVGTYRDLELSEHPALASLVSGLLPAQRIALAGLARPQVERLLAQRLGRPPAPRVCEAVHRLSAGNPLLIGELARRHEALGDALDLSGLSDFALPERIAEAVRRKLTGLPEPARAALSAASVLGRELALPLLAQLLQLPEPALLELLAPALRGGLIERVPGAEGRLLFAHATVCNAIYSALPATRRIELHRRVAELLEAGQQDRLPLYEIAHHYHLAAAGGARKKAIEYAARAAQQAHLMRAYEVGAVLYERAHALGELDGSDGESQHALLLAVGDAWYRAGELERATARLDLAAERAWAEGRTEHYVAAVLSATFVVRGTLMHDAVRQEQLRRALSVIGPGDSMAHAMLLGASLLALRAPEALAERFATSQRATEMARRLDDSYALELALNVQHYGLWGAAHPAELLRVADELAALTHKTGNDELHLDALMWRVADQTELGNLSQAVEAYERYVALAERGHSPYHRYMGVTAECLSWTARGDFTRACELSERALQLGKRVQEPLAEGFHAVRRLFLALERAEPAEALIAADPPACVPADYRVFWGLGWARCGRTGDVQRMLATHAGRFDRLPIDGMRRPILSALGEMSVLLGDTRSAEQLYPLLLPDADMHLLLQAGVYMGPVSYYLGRLAALLGRTREAEQHLEVARARCASADMRPYSLRSQLEYARLLSARPSERARGGELLARAREEARTLGMAED